MKRLIDVEFREELPEDSSPFTIQIEQITSHLSPAEAHLLYRLLGLRLNEYEFAMAKRNFRPAKIGGVCGA